MWLGEVYGIMSVHGDMPLNYTDPEKTPATLRSLYQVLFGKYKSCEWNGTFYKGKNVTGEITGGNLSIIYSLIGTAAEPSTRGKILFIEDVGEYFYHIDRMLISLKLAGKLEGLIGLVIGGMNKIEEAKVKWGKSVEETIIDIVGEYDYPLFFNFPAGHISDNRAFYIGKQSSIKLKGTKAKLTFER